MRSRKSIAIGAVSLAIGAAAVIFFVSGSSRSENQQNVASTHGQQSVSPTGDSTLISQASGDSSFLYLKNPSNGKSVRLTAASSGIESEPSFSHDRKLVVYSFASSTDSKSAVWVVGVDGSNPHALTGKDEDALHPVFSPDDLKVFYGASRFTGNYSPIVRPARHDWDVFSVPIQSNATPNGSPPAQVTHNSSYDLLSLDAAADGINPGGTKLLISTSGYPIGALIREFDLGAAGREKIFQPHVPDEPSSGPAYGEARYINDGMDILFLAATNKSGGDYAYNVYSMSDVTGSDIKQLTNFKGMTRELKVLPGGKATFVNGRTLYLLDIGTQAVKPL